jgi:methionine synthase II (cobalamin-independent)
MNSPGAFQTTAVGSFPHAESGELSHRLATSLDIPCWPQLPRRSFRESMYVQYGPNLPAARLDDSRGKLFFDTTGDISQELELFYSHYLADDLATFALVSVYAAGFFTMLEALEKTDGEWAKGQVTGPISFGLTVTDQDLRPSLYNELLADVIVKNMAMNARWQIRQLKRVRPRVIIFVDEPYMAAFGSAFISLSREQAIDMLDEVFQAIRQEGAMSGVHCCANTDWSVLMATSVEILNLDAYGYLENLALYPAELRHFLDRGGIIAWGIIPNNNDVLEATAESLAGRLYRGMKLIQEKAAGRGVQISIDELAERSLITTSCGLGPATIAMAEKALDTLVQIKYYLEW